MFRVRVGLWGKVGSCIRCVESATCIRCVASASCIRCVASASCIGIEVHAKIGVQIRCVGQVIVAPASRPVARGVSTISSGRKSRIIRNAPKLCSPSTFIGIDVHAKIGIKIHCLGQVLMFPPLVPWHVAYGLWTTRSVKKSKLFEMLRNFADPFYMY